MAYVEAGVTLFQIQPFIVLNLRDGAAADRRSVVDGVAILIHGLDGDAFFQPFTHADDDLVQPRCGDGIFIREGLRVGCGDRGGGGVRRTDDIERAALGTVIAKVDDDSVRQAALDVDVVDLHVAQAVILVDRIGVLNILGGAAKAVGERHVGEAAGLSNDTACLVGGG